MKVTKQDLDSISAQGILTHEQCNALWEALSQRYQDTPRFDLIHVGYYTGALIIILAMGWFLAMSWQPYGHGGILMISTLYAVAMISAGNHLWHKHKLKVAGGLLWTVGVCMTPLIVYAIENMAGLWVQGDPGSYSGYHDYVKGSWIVMEAATVLVSLWALSYVRFPFLLAPLSFSLWYMSMDLTPLIVPNSTADFWSHRALVSVCFGALVLLTGYVVDIKNASSEDYSFWLYLFGMMAFWGGMVALPNHAEMQQFLFCLMNIGFMILSVLWQRKVFIVFGGIGVTGYLFHLSYTLFHDTMQFPIALSALGLGIIYGAIRYQKNRQSIEKRVLALVPQGILDLMPARRRAKAQQKARTAHQASGAVG